MKTTIVKILPLVAVMSASIFFAGCNKSDKTANQNNNEQKNNDLISPVSNQNDKANLAIDTGTSEIEENTEITTIKKYYSFLSNNDFEKAYQMRSDQTDITYNKFKDWYENVQHIKPYDFNKTNSGSYKFYVEYKDRNKATTKFEVEMLVIENKLKTLSSVEATKKEEQSEDDVSDWLTYTNAEAKFKIRYPKTYAVTKYKDYPEIISLNFKDTNNVDYHGGEIYIKIGDKANTPDGLLAEIKKECDEYDLCAEIPEDKIVDLSNIKGVRKITYSRAIGGYATSYFFTGKDGQVNFELNFNFKEDEVRGKIINSFEFL